MPIGIVEDEKRLAENAARAWPDGAGDAVAVAGKSAEGVCLAESHAYDFLIMELMLPRRDRWSFVLKLRPGPV
jgi:DNA-binding response OmpR family regulator